METVKVQTLKDNTTGEAIAPRTHVSALSGTGTAGQVVGFTENNVVGVMDVDSALSAESGNPVQNKAVYQALNNKVQYGTSVPELLEDGCIYLVYEE